MDIQFSSSRSCAAAICCNQNRQPSSHPVVPKLQLANISRGSQLQPPIVNLDAQQLAKGRKISDPSTETVFRMIKDCLPYKKSFFAEDYEKSACIFKNSYPEIYSYILKNGPEVREKMAQYIRNPNSPLPQKVKEILYWLPGIAGQNIPLQPEIVSGILRKYIMKNYTPEEIAEELARDGDFLFALTEISFKDLEANALCFSKDDAEIVREFLLASLRLLYLQALQSTELVTHLLRTCESSEENVLSRLFEISQPQFFNCSSWQQVEEFFKEALSQPLVKDPQHLQKTAQKFRSWMTDLKELERAFFLNREQLLFLAEKSFNYDQKTPTFPICRQQFPILFDRLDLCRKEFDYEGVLKAVSRSFQECQDLLALIQSKTEKTDLRHFYSTHDIAIYQASLLLLSELFSANEPGKMKTNGIPTEQDLYGFCIDHFGLDPIEWIEQLIADLSPADFSVLKEGFQNMRLNHWEDPLEIELQESLLLEKRVDLLIGHLKEKLQLPEDLADFKNRFEFHSGEPS